MVRISFSNLFKEFKSTATWLQFPFVCGAAKASVYDCTARASRRGEERAVVLLPLLLAAQSGLGWPITAEINC